MALTYIKLFVDYLDAIELLDDGERGRLFTGLLEYARSGIAPELPGNERYLFPMMRAQLDRDAASYENLCGTKRANGRQGGRPPKKPLGFSETEKSKDKDKDKDEEKEKENIFCGAGGPARRKYPSKGRSAARRESPEAVRSDMARMERFLLKLRAEAGEAGGRPAPR